MLEGSQLQAEMRKKNHKTATVADADAAIHHFVARILATIGDTTLKSMMNGSETDAILIGSPSGMRDTKSIRPMNATRFSSPRYPNQFHFTLRYSHEI
jgi:hypothetical protein